ncbi:MAG: ABC transporter ATP-binding protein/permease, partial [Clostridia bacterium]|nr:ABC transporter ATP-binding protein/permease [Clostridia bacterium]
MNEVYPKHKLSKAGTLWYLLKGSAWVFVASIVASAFATLVALLVPEIINITVDSILGSEPVSDSYANIITAIGGVEYLKENLWIIALMLIACALLSALFTYSRVYLNTLANQIFMRRTRDKLFSHLQRLPLGWHIQHRTGDIIQRCTSDADTISNFVSGQLINLFRIVLLMVFSLVFMFSKNVKLAAIASAFIPLIIGYSFLFHRHMRRYFKKCDEEEGVLSTIAQENFTGVRVVRAFGRERYERDRFEKQNTYYTGLWTKTLRVLATFWSSSDCIASLQGLCIVVAGTVFCVNGSLTTGELIAFIFYNTMLIGPIRQLGRIISNMSKAGVSLGRIGEILGADEEEYGEKLPLSGDIEFKNVSFEYEEGKPVVTDISFKIPEGSVVGILGGTGSGKSTLTYLLDGLYAPTNGEIYIGGKPVSEIPPATLRSNIGLMLQEGYIYSGTIRENISIAADNATGEDIKNAAKDACVDDNIEGFANGYDTIVGERGVTLSGGQKQRVGIARTLLRNTPYLIFDDSLSAVDSETDAAIRKKLNKKFKGATVIIISHRINTVMHADNIIVLDGGKIAESGTNAELLKKNGIYKKIYDLQFQLPD